MTPTATGFLDEELAGHRERLNRYAFRLTRDHHDAEDLVQDTMARAIRNRDKFMRGTNLAGWLETMALHLRYSHLRQFRSRLKYWARNLEAQTIDPVGPRNVEDEVIARFQLQSVLEGADPLLGLSLVFDEADLSRRFGITGNAVRSRVTRARNRAKARVWN